MPICKDSLQGAAMIFCLLAYLAGMTGVVLLIDRRLRAGQRQREAAFFATVTGLLV